ncbi:unnamed protein product [Trifolium pratense]|nr:unnamed protein product [Trifolium pratense]
MKAKVIKPTGATFNILMHAYSRRIQSKIVEKAYVAFENMIRDGIKLSTETYSTLLDAFRRAGDTETLMKIWKLIMNQ